MLGDWDGAPAPDWGEVCEDAQVRGTLYNDWRRVTGHAEAIMALDTSQSIALSHILLDHAESQQKRTELDLWLKIERAAHFERGSLTGAPGVKQRIFL